MTEQPAGAAPAGEPAGEPAELRPAGVAQGFAAGPAERTLQDPVQYPAAGPPAAGRGDGRGEGPEGPTPPPALWGKWRRWRRSRPFWGGLLTLLAGVEITYLPLAPLQVMVHQGVAGIPSVLMGVILILLGLAMWFSPQSRILSGVVAVLVACAALVLSNLGGFLIGTLLAIAGGGLGFAWQPRRR